VGGKLLADDEDSQSLTAEPEDGSLPDHYKASHEPLPENERPFGRYTLLRRLAYGGMGEIFLARQGGQGQLSNISKLVVIKRILNHVRRDEKHRKMFLEEARLQALLANQHIVQIHDMGDQDGHVYLAMEHVHGPSWRGVVDRCRKRKEFIPLAHVCEMVAQAARGLSYAHNLVDATGQPLRIVHRDINPHNVLVTYDGQVKIIDFGIAKSELADGHTETGTIKGKFSYMSPEQSAAKHLDKRSDLFTLGICLYELATLVNPFRKGNVVLSLDAIQRENPMPLERKRREAAVLQPIIDRCLAKNRDDRFDDTQELADALDALVASGEIAPAPVPLSTWLRERFQDEIAEHVSILEQTGSSGVLAVRGSDPSSLLRRRPATSKPSGMPLPTSPNAETVVEAAPDSNDLIASSIAPQHTVDAPLPIAEQFADDILDEVPSELTSSTPPPGEFDVRSIADHVEPSRSSRAPWVIAAFVLVASTAGTAALLTQTSLLDSLLGRKPAAPAVAAAGTPVETKPPAVVPPPVEVKPLVEPVKPVEQVTPPVEPVTPPVEQVTPPVVEPVKAVEEQPAGGKRTTRKQPKPDNVDKTPPPVEKGPIAARLSFKSDGFAVKGNRSVPLGGSTVLTINEADAPFKLTVKVRADEAGKLSLDVDAEPWAILRVNGIGKGKTPQRGIAFPDGAAALDLARPGGGTMSLTIVPK
jgi:serine/threonine-protein kinase